MEAKALDFLPLPPLPTSGMYSNQSPLLKYAILTTSRVCAWAGGSPEAFLLALFQSLLD